VLYARCGFCGGIAPLWCAGRFMPHVPAYVEATPMGAACPMCGVLPPVFTCMVCGNGQFLFLPGAPMPAPSFPGASQNFAPVIQAQPGASESVLTKAFGEFATKFAGVLGTQAAGAMFGQQQ